MEERSEIEIAQDYDPDTDPYLNPGIAEVVRYLRAHGFVTTDSGDGETGYWPECDLPLPFVHVLSDERRLFEDAHALHALFLGDNAPSRLYVDPEAFDVQASYSPVNGVALVSLFGVSDPHAERDEARIESLRAAIRASRREAEE